MRYFFPASYALLLAGALLAGCAKEKVSCGHGVPTPRLRFQIVDDQTGADWFDSPGSLSPDSLQRLNSAIYRYLSISRIDTKVQWATLFLGQDEYYLPETGGELMDTYLLRLSTTDTDTLEARTQFGRLITDACQHQHYLQTVELRYNGRVSGMYSASSQPNVGNFYCAGCEPIIALRKRR